MADIEKAKGPDYADWFQNCFLYERLTGKGKMEITDLSMDGALKVDSPYTNEEIIGDMRLWLRMAAKWLDLENNKLLGFD